MTPPRLQAAPPEVLMRTEDDQLLASRVWRLPAGWRSISSAPLGGGVLPCAWVLNTQVRDDYESTDPVGDLTTLTNQLQLTGVGVGMMTAVDVRVAAAVIAEGISVDATVGIRGAQWAAAPPNDGAAPNRSASHVPGTINVVAFVPEPLSDAALVNAVATVTEAKVQAMWDAGHRGTGTPTDAICLVCPEGRSPHPYGGPRSIWGARLARVVHQAVLEGCAVDRSSTP